MVLEEFGTVRVRDGVISGTIYHTQDSCAALKEMWEDECEQISVTILKQFGKRECIRCHRIRTVEEHAGVILVGIDPAGQRAQLLVKGHKIWLPLYSEFDYDSIRNWRNSYDKSPAIRQVLPEELEVLGATPSREEDEGESDG